MIAEKYYETYIRNGVRWRNLKIIIYYNEVKLKGLLKN